MLTMLPIRDLAVIRSLNEQYGVSCGLGYQLLEGGRQTGCLLYNLTPEEGEILALDAPDRLAAEGLLRAAMGSLLDAGISRVRFGEMLDHSLLEGLGFVQKGESLCPDIEKILFSCSSCKK